MVSTSFCCVITNEMVLCSWNFHAINHDEINRVLLIVFNSFIITCLIIVQSCTIFQSCTINQYCTIVQCYTIVQSSNIIKFTNSNNIQFISSQFHLATWMEHPSRTAPHLDTLFTPPVYKTCIFHQDFSSRDSLMLPNKVNTFKLSVMISFLSPQWIGGHQSFSV